MDKTCNQPKTMNPQFGFYMEQKTAMKNNLIALPDQTYLEANNFSTDLPTVTATPERPFITLS